MKSRPFHARLTAWGAIFSQLLPVLALWAPATAVAVEDPYDAANVNSGAIAAEVTCDGICDAILPQGEWTASDDQWCVNHGERGPAGMLTTPDATATKSPHTSGCSVPLRQEDLNAHGGDANAACQAVNQKLLVCKFRNSTVALQCQAKKAAKADHWFEKYILPLDAAAAATCSLACVAGRTPGAQSIAPAAGMACKVAGLSASAAEIYAVIAIQGDALGKALSGAGALVGFTQALGADYRRGPSSFDAFALLETRHRHFVEPTLEFLAALGAFASSEALAQTPQKKPLTPASSTRVAQKQSKAGPALPNMTEFQNVVRNPYGAAVNQALDRMKQPSTQGSPMKAVTRNPAPRQPAPLPSSANPAAAQAPVTQGTLDEYIRRFQAPAQPKPLVESGSGFLDSRLSQGSTPSGATYRTLSRRESSAPEAAPSPALREIQTLSSALGRPSPTTQPSPVGNLPEPKFSPAITTTTPRYTPAPITEVKMPSTPEVPELPPMKRDPVLTTRTPTTPPPPVPEVAPGIVKTIQEKQAQEVQAAKEAVQKQEQAQQVQAEKAAVQRQAKTEDAKNKNRAACLAALTFSALTGLRIVNAKRAENTAKSSCEEIKKLYSDALVNDPTLPAGTSTRLGSTTTGGGTSKSGSTGARNGTVTQREDAFASDIGSSDLRARMSEAVDGKLLMSSGLDRLVAEPAKRLNADSLIRAADNGQLGQMLGTAAGGSPIAAALGQLAQAAFQNPSSRLSLSPNVESARYSGGGGGAPQQGDAGEPKMPDLAALLGGGGGDAGHGGPERSIAFDSAQETDIWHSNTDQNLFQIVSGRIEKSARRVLPVGAR